MPSFAVESSKLQALGLPLGIKMRLMTALDKMSLVELEEFAAKLRHAIARNPENSRMEQRTRQCEAVDRNSSEQGRV
jgi:BMFP domain-containing protein YqiC